MGNNLLDLWPGQSNWPEQLQMSDDGSTVVWNPYIPIHTTFIWTLQHGGEILDQYFLVRDISADGAVLAGEVRTYGPPPDRELTRLPTRWTREEGFVTHTGPAGFTGPWGTRAVSADGNVILVGAEHS
jgi:hypothetical protein